MYCRNCGEQIDDLALICSKCGASTTADAAPPPYKQQQQYQQTQQYQQPPYQQPVYQQPLQQQYQQPYPQNFGHQYPYQTSDYILMEASQKGDSAYTMAIIGLIIGLFIPLVGFILGCIAIGRGGQSYRITGNPKYNTAKTIGIAAIVVSVISWIVKTLIIIGLFNSSY